MAEYCATCGQRIPQPPKPARICSVCQQPIMKGHKWQIVDSKIQHRVCERPDTYRKEF